jgi:putative pyruvate formate lyase activating enzyme
MERYRSILKGSPARHILLKSIAVDADFVKLPTTELWHLHNGMLGVYRKLNENYRSIEGSPEPKSPSLLDVKIELAERILDNCVLCQLRCQADRNSRPGACGFDSGSYYNYDCVDSLVQDILRTTYSIIFKGCTIRTFLYKEFKANQDPASRAIDSKRLAAAIDAEYGRYMPGKRKARGGDEPLKLHFTGGEPIPHLYGILDTLKYVTVNIATVFDSNMYMTPEALRLLDGAIDLYAGEFTFGNDAHALRYYGAKNYWSTVTRAFTEAKKQADVILYHVPLSGHLECCSKPVAEWCAKYLGTDTYVYLHTDYHLKYDEFPELRASLSKDESRRAYDIFDRAGFRNVDMFCW